MTKFVENAKLVISILVVVLVALPVMAAIFILKLPVFQGKGKNPAAAYTDSLGNTRCVLYEPDSFRERAIARLTRLLP